MTQFRRPVVSVILATDTLATINPVLDRLRQLPAPDRLEVILVSPSPENLRPAATGSGFHQVVISPVDSLTPLGVARARGVRAAQAPYVFIGETHSFLWPDALDRLLETLDSGEAEVAVPGLVNANPHRVFSWASYFLTYSVWDATLPAGPLTAWPVYNFLAHRDHLLALGDTLENDLEDGEMLPLRLCGGRYRVRHVSAALLDHFNLETPRPCLHEFFLLGVYYGSRRATRWSWLRRIAYVAGSGLVPAVLMARRWRSGLRVLRANQAPWLALPAAVLLCSAKVLGEAVGYAGLARPADFAAKSRYEVRRLDFVSALPPR